MAYGDVAGDGCSYVRAECDFVGWGWSCPVVDDVDLIRIAGITRNGPCMTVAVVHDVYVMVCGFGLPLSLGLMCDGCINCFGTVVLGAWASSICLILCDCSLVLCHSWTLGISTVVFHAVGITVSTPVVVCCLSITDEMCDVSPVSAELALEVSCSCPGVGPRVFVVVTVWVVVTYGLFFVAFVTLMELCRSALTIDREDIITDEPEDYID